MDKDKREDELSQLFVNIRLIGELRFTSTEIDYWKNKKELQDLNVWEKYPSLAAFITVGIGNLYYDGGNLWGAFEWLTDTNVQNKWGSQFEEFVKAHDFLETFQVLKKEKHRRYVAPILAHGGIPQYCLDDFFKLITKHSDPQSFGSEFISELQENRNWLSNIDTPIKSFLLHGGEVAEAFVSRFLAIWGSRDRGDGGGNHGLPERVVEKFGEWFITNRPIKGERRKRLPKPEIHISPGDLWVYLFLPRCDDHEEVGLNAIWNYSGKKLAVTRQHKIQLSINEQWSVELQYGCKSNLFSLHGLTNTLPAMFFDPSTGKVIADPQNRRLPEHLWIVYNRKEIVRPEARYIDNFDHWPGYCAGFFDLTNYRYLNLSNQEFEVRRPFFAENDSLVNGVTSEDGLPIINAPPQICWKGDANFSLKRNGVDEGNIDIPAKNFQMWFDHPGDYEFTLRGSLGQIIRKHFVLVPELKVNLKPEVMWPDKKSVDVDVSIQNGLVFSGEQNESPFIAYENPFPFSITKYSKALKIEIPHLEWKLNFSKIEDEDQDWHATPDEVEFDVLEQVDYPRLAIRINGPVQDLEIHLLGKNGKVESPQSKRISISKNIWSFDLRHVQDQVLNSGRSETFDVQVTKKGKQLYRGKILSVRPQWDLQKLDANWKKATGVYVTVKNRNAMIDGCWLVIFPLFRPWSKEICKHHLEAGKNMWLPEVDFEPGRYLVRAIHAPWGVVDWFKAEPLKEQCFDVNKEIWPEYYGLNNSSTSLKKYTECLIAHFCHPQLVPNPKSPESLVSDDIVRFLNYLEQFDKMHSIRKPTSLLSIFCLNPRSTTNVFKMKDEIPDFWRKVLPSFELIELVPKKKDIEFIEDIVFNYDLIPEAANQIQKDHRKRSLSAVLVKWHEFLSMNIIHSNETMFLIFAEIIFLCRKFELYKKMSPNKQRYYNKLEKCFNFSEGL